MAVMQKQDPLIRAYERHLAGFGLPDGISVMQAQRAAEEALAAKYIGDDGDEYKYAFCR